MHSILSKFSAPRTGGRLVVVIALWGMTTGRADAVDQCKVCQPYHDLIASMERMCLSDSSVGASTSLKGALDVFKKAIEGDARLSLDTIRGARRDWDATNGRAENKEIRECLKPLQDRLLACIDRCVAGQQSDAFPPELNLQFRMTTPGSRNPALMNDRVILGVKTPPRLRPEKQLFLDTDGLFHDDIATPRTDGKFHAMVHRAVKDGFSNAVDALQYTEMCLRRSPNPPATGNPLVRLVCREGELCTTFDPLDPGYLALCDPRVEFRSKEPELIRTAASNFSFIPSAQAETAERVWVVPSLESLASRKTTTHDGYTVFTLESMDLGNLNADGVSLHLRVNDVEVRVEGLPSEMLTRVFNAQKPFRMDFGLQNLDFDGKLGGCDIVKAELRFWKNGDPVGVPIVLQRLYAALRDGETLTFNTEQDYHFTWSARYERPSKPVDYRVFISSILFNSWDDLKDRGHVEREIAKLEVIRHDIDQLHLVHEGQPIVAVMRPPLSKPSWGLALGLRQETGQIRFTFTKPEAERFHAFVRAQRALGKPTIERLFRTDSYLYIERPNVERPSLCFISSNGE